MVDISKNETCRYKEMSCHMFVVQHVEKCQKNNVESQSIKDVKPHYSSSSKYFFWLNHSFPKYFFDSKYLRSLFSRMTLNIHDYKFGVLFFSNNFLITGGFSIGARWCVHWGVDLLDVFVFLLKIPYVARKCFTCTKKYDFV